MAEMPEVIITHVEAIRLEPGGIYVIEAQYRFKNQADLDHYVKEINAVGDKYGVKFILLESGLKIARAEIAK